MKDVLDSQDFYEIMQVYRYADHTNQDLVDKRFEDVKDFIRENFRKGLPSNIVEALNSGDGTYRP